MLNPRQPHPNQHALGASPHPRPEHPRCPQGAYTGPICTGIALVMSQFARKPRECRGERLVGAPLTRRGPSQPALGPSSPEPEVLASPCQPVHHQSLCQSLNVTLVSLRHSSPQSCAILHPEHASGARGPRWGLAQPGGPSLVEARALAYTKLCLRAIVVTRRCVVE